MTNQPKSPRDYLQEGISFAGNALEQLASSAKKKAEVLFL